MLLVVPLLLSVSSMSCDLKVPMHLRDRSIMLFSASKTDQLWRDGTIHWPKERPLQRSGWLMYRSPERTTHPRDSSMVFISVLRTDVLAHNRTICCHIHDISKSGDASIDVPSTFTSFQTSLALSLAISIPGR